MEIFKEGDKVKWIHKMKAVPHPEGKTDRNGVVLPVFRDTEREGTIIRAIESIRTCQVRPDSTLNKGPAGMGSYYDLNIEKDLLEKI